MEKQITIIIPTYNMERYIGKCIESLLIPELNEVEVLVVNDGSRDNSSAIAHNYADRYPDSIKVIDKPNGNYGSCINVGLEMASGKYVKILDADDSFDTNAFSRFVKFLEKTDADVVFSDYVIVDEDGKETSICTPNLSTVLEIQFDKIVDAIIGFSQMHGIAYRTSLLGDMHYRQTEGVSYTDTEWAYAPLALANYFAYSSQVRPLYRYLVGRAGQTMDPQLFLKKLPEQFKVLLAKASAFDRYHLKLSEPRLRYMIYNFQNQSHYIYLNILSSKSTVAKQLLCDYESSLKGISHELYEIIGDLDYTPSTPYKMVQAFRNNAIPTNFTIPVIQRARRVFNGLMCKVLG